MILHSFQVGQKVLCVENTPDPHKGFCELELDRIYTISDLVTMRDGGVVAYLKGLKHEWQGHSRITGMPVVVVGFGLKRLRPIVRSLYRIDPWIKADANFISLMKNVQQRVLKKG
jgi:hypothetical protein